MKQSEILANDGAALCGWCGVPFGSTIAYEGQVCSRCVALLRQAGIADEEIFFEETAGRDNNLSPKTTEKTDANPTETPRHLQTSE